MVSVDGAAWDRTPSQDLVSAKVAIGIVSITLVHLVVQFHLFQHLSRLTTVLLLLEQYTDYQQYGAAAALIQITMDIWYLHQLLDHVTQHSQIHAVVTPLVVVVVAAGAVALLQLDIDAIQVQAHRTLI